MKVIENKKFTITLAGQDNELTYAEVYIQVLSSQPQGGFSLSDYSERLKVLDKLKEAKDTIELEDAEHALLISALDNFKPAILDKGIGESVNALREAKE